MYPIIIPQIWWFKQLQSNLYLLAKPYRLHIPFRELFNPSLRRRLARNECWRHEHVIVLSPPDTGLDGCLDPMPVMFRINIDWYNPIPRSFLKNHGEWSRMLLILQLFFISSHAHVGKIITSDATGDVAMPKPSESQWKVHQTNRWFYHQHLHLRSGFFQPAMVWWNRRVTQVFTWTCRSTSKLWVVSPPASVA